MLHDLSDQNPDVGDEACLDELNLLLKLSHAKEFSCAMPYPRAPLQRYTRYPHRRIMGAEMTVAREVLTWDRFGAATRELSRKIVASGFVPEVVVAIARGGLLPAGAIAYGLGAKNCGTLNVEFYTGIGTVLDQPEVLPPELDLGYLKGRRVLLVDDVADSGQTLKLGVELLEAEGALVRSVTIFTKPTTIVQPDYVWKHTNLWIDFPWSADGSVSEEDADATERSA